MRGLREGDLGTMNKQFVDGAALNGTGDPDRGRHRKDDPATIAEMNRGGNS